MDRHGMAVFGGGWLNWESKWECERIIDGIQDWDFNSDEAGKWSLQTPAGQLTEVVNVCRLEDIVGNGMVTESEYMKSYLERCT
eukprot:3947026-Karenia_brevis.AAC.1